MQSRSSSGPGEEPPSGRQSVRGNRLAINNEEYILKQMKSEAKAANKKGEISPLSLLGVCAVHGVSTRAQAHKDEMRDLVLRGGPWTEDEKQQILDYCAEDVYDTTALLAAFWPKIQDA
jgi:hypothetical protein